MSKASLSRVHRERAFPRSSPRSHRPWLSRFPWKPRNPAPSGPGSGASPYPMNAYAFTRLGQNVPFKNLSVAGRSWPISHLLQELGRCPCAALLALLFQPLSPRRRGLSLPASRPPPPRPVLTWPVNNKSNPGKGKYPRNRTCFLHLTVIRGAETRKYRRRFTRKGVWAGACE